MNGIGLLLLLATAGQVGFGTERDYGWEYAPDGVLQYIVQISPQKAEMMKQRSIQFPQGTPNISDIPPELVGKIGKIKILIGNENLPRNPSIEELRRLPALGDTIPSSSTAKLGVPRDVEPELIRINQSDTPPALPAFPTGNGSGASSSFRDKFSRAPEAVGQEAENVVDRARSIASGLEEKANDSLASITPDPSLLAQNGAGFQGSESMNGLRTGGSNAPPSKFNSSPATNPSSNPPNNNPAMPPFPGANASNLNNQNLNNQNLNSTNQNTGNQNTGNLTGNQREGASSPWPGFTRQQQNNGLNTQGNNTGNLNNPGLQPQTPSPTFGSTPSSGNNSGYSMAPNTNSQMYNTNPGSNFGYDRMAGLNGSQPPPNYINTGATNNGQTQMNNGFGQTTLPPAQTNRTVQSDPFPLQNNTSTTTTSSSENALRLCFLASLIVNVYFGVLMRKLLTRYRLMLVNSRNQMA